MNMIYLVILSPIISFIFLFFLKYVLSYQIITIFNFFMVFLSTISVFFLDTIFIKSTHTIVEKILWSWWSVKNFKIDIGFLVDNLTCVFLSMITLVAFLVFLFSIWYMKNEINNIIFFELMTLFVINMLILVLSNNFIIMYLGWEGISVCSYVLINFYYSKLYVNISAMKSFIFTKIGDLFLITAILLFYIHYHSLNFYEIAFLSKVHLIKYTLLLNIINILFLMGAIGKSAQIPLQIWLPEAMVGPTPVSALIHAATMVTAGIYLISRNHSLFILTPSILYMIGIIGSLTLLLSSIVALVESDIKRILAYSTMSQIGYMFIALSVGAWNAAIIHLVVHAFFKALLFLSAGILIKKCCYEQNIFFMGNQLYKIFPFLYCCFLVGGAALSGFPILTAGFYSKDSILFYIYNSNNIFFFIVSMLSIFFTTLYIFRLIFITFHTVSTNHVKKSAMNFFQYIPLSIFIIFSTYFGKFIFPNLSSIFPIIVSPHNNSKLYLEIISSILVISSVIVAYYCYVVNIGCISKVLILKFLNVLLCIVKNTGFGLFYIYDALFITLYLKVTSFFSRKFFDIFHDFLLFFIQKFNFLLMSTENISLNFYIILISLNAMFVMFFIFLY